MYSKPFPTLIPTHLVPSHCLYPFGGDNSVLPYSIHPLDSTRLPRLHRWIPSSPCTTQRRRVRRVLHNFVEFILLYTTAKREASSKGTGGVPGTGGGVIGGKNITGSPNDHGRKRGIFLGTCWCTSPEGKPTTRRPATERPGWRPTTGRPGWMGSTEWCRTRGSRTGKSCRSGKWICLLYTSPSPRDS